MNRKVDTGKTLKRWPVFVDHYKQKGIEKGRLEGIQIGEEKGRNEGKLEGEREATLKIARTMLKNGLDLSSVMKMTGLTADELEQIRH